MQRILFAIDFDKNAAAIFDYTLLLADKFKATIVLFHAFGSGELFTKKEKIAAENRTLAQMEVFVNQYLPATYKHIELEYLTDAGFAYAALPKVVKAQGIDLAVMGMKKGKRLLESLLGNTTLEVSPVLPCAVLIVPAGFFTTQISAIACTTNFRFRDIALIRWLKSSSKLFGKKTSIHCLHILEKESERSRAEKDMAVLESIFERQTGIDFNIEAGRFLDTLEYFVVSRTIDLLVMNAHQRTTLGHLLSSSTTQKVSIGTKVPLLILKNL